MTATATLPQIDRPAAIKSPFVVTIDRREQQPWTFDGLTAGAADNYASLIVHTEPATLQTGDYGIIDMPGIAIERKSLADLYGTLTVGRQRFVRELERLAELDFAAVVIEASWHHIAHDPPFRMRAKPRSIVASILAWQQRYPIAWLTAGDRRMAAALGYRMLERFWRDKQEGKRS